MTDILNYLVNLQNDICLSLEELDGKAKFITDEWKREEGGGGITRVISNGNIFEKGGVNFSHVFGKIPDILKSEERNAEYFHAAGISIVIHPFNPFVPIIHMNVRYFKMSESKDGDIADEWF